MRDAFKAGSAVFVSPPPVRPRLLRRSFEQWQHVVIARDGDRVVGRARLLSDGVRNAYLLDVSTTSSHRRQGVGSGVMRLLCERVPGQHVGPRTDGAQALCESLGFRPEPQFWSCVVDEWFDNDGYC